MRRNGKNKMIMFLCVALVFMGIGYATLQSNLNISGTAKSSGVFGVEIFSIAETQDSIDNGGVTTKSAVRTDSNKNADFNAAFTKPGDYVEYKMTLKNTGTIEAVVEMEIDDSGNQKDSQNNNIFIFEVRDDTTGHKIRKETIQNMILEPGESRIFTVKMSYNVKAIEFPSSSVTFTITTNVTQKGNNIISNLIEDEVDLEWDFELDEDGKILAYNALYPGVVDEDGYVVVPSVNVDGEPIKEITSTSFVEQITDNLFMEDDSNDNTVKNVYIDYPKGSSEYNTIKTSLNSMGITDSSEAQGTINKSSINPGKLIDKRINPKTKKISDTVYKFYGKGEYTPTESAQGFYMDPKTGQIVWSESTSKVEKLDLSQATNLEKIGENSFSGGLLTEIVFPDNSKLTSIGAYAFNETKLSNIAIPKTITAINDYAFADCQLEGELIIPANIVTIGTAAFGQQYSYGSGTNKISKLTFENGSKLQTIGVSAFKNNQLEGTVEIPNGVVSIGSNAFEGSNNEITSLTIPNSVTTIGSDAFLNAKIQSLSIDMTAIPANIFDSKSLQTLTFGSHVQTIGSATFKNNVIAGTFAIPSSITTIGSNAFYSNKISNLNLSNATNLQTIGNSAFSFNQLSTLNLNDAINLQTIGSNAFAANKLSGTLTIPSNVISIEAAAFGGSPTNNQIKTLDLSNATSLQTIGDSAFKNNAIEGTLTIPDNVTTIGGSAFYGNLIETLNLGSGLTALRSAAFSSNKDSNDARTIKKININMTKATWNSRNLSKNTWYDGYVTPTYNT